jgi:hypothetical protein
VDIGDHLLLLLPVSDVKVVAVAVVVGLFVKRHGTSLLSDAWIIDGYIARRTGARQPTAVGKPMLAHTLFQSCMLIHHKHIRIFI